MGFFTLIISLLLSQSLGMMEEPVKATKHLSEVSAEEAVIEFSLKAQKGWHIYSTDLPEGGPVSASFQIDSISGVRLSGPLTFDGEEIETDDPVFGMTVRYFTGSVMFKQAFEHDDDWFISGYLNYGACNDRSCLPPQKVEFKYGSAKASASNVPAEGLKDDISAVPGYNEAQWAPVNYPDGTETGRGGRGLLGLFLTSLLGGLLALLTPCVWPIIPMTVSFFLKRAEEQRSAVRDAILYGVSIIAVYVALGLAITLIFGANALNALATNAIVNIIFFLVLVVFALSFFGLFEITLPSSWSTGMNSKSKKGGYGGIFFMALTLTIVSFSCTGPIIGFLLVDAASNGSILAPVTGMFGFSLAMAVPFALFAMFPQWLKSMPRSGGWMDKVKVTLAFVELAFALKFLSVADMAYGWGILPRDLFVALWLIMAILLGLYLLGIIRFHKGEERKSGVLGKTVGVISLLFAAWLVPGLWGAPLKGISAFTPPMSTQHWRRISVQVEPQYTDFAEGLAASASTGKPLLIDFTGYGCVNCRKMETSVWTDPQVAEKIQDDFILVSLFVDDKTPLEKPVTVVENGAEVRLRTVGDKWSLLQRSKFGANAQPFYVVTDAGGKLLSGPYTFDTEISHFLKFLEIK